MGDSDGGAVGNDVALLLFLEELRQLFLALDAVLLQGRQIFDIFFDEQGERVRLADVSHECLRFHDCVQLVVHVELKVLVVEHVPVEGIVPSFEILLEVLKPCLLAQMHAPLNHLVCHFALFFCSSFLEVRILHPPGKSLDGEVVIDDETG